MTANPIVPAEVRAQIHFETLLAQALQRVDIHAGQVWTDTAEHDPGVTLLQALAYAISDLSYRHTLPLVDLLTPEHKEGKDGVFPHTFGPHRALTCSPITEDDYRRAILDLHSADDSSVTESGGGKFFFRDAQLVRQLEGEQYHYLYEPGLRQFVFRPSEDTLDSDIQALTVVGGYHLYVEPNRDVDLGAAQRALDDFLFGHRNLCEQVRQQTWLEPLERDIWLTIDLDDDCMDPARVLAEIYMLTESALRPEVMRYSAADLAAQGMSNDAIYEGPRLLHGWIPTLPPARDFQASRVVSLVTLSNGLMAIDGVRTIRHLGWSDSPGWELGVAPDQYLLPWGRDPFAALADGGSVKLFKRGALLKVNAGDIASYVRAPERIDEPEVVMDFGRWRDPAKYYYASQRLPPCYGLEDDLPDAGQKQLHQFLLPFEQHLVDGCVQLALLPDLLSFRRRGDSVTWGTKWPFPSNSVPNAVHVGEGYRAELEAWSEDHAVDDARELAIVDYLLGYFGDSRAARTLPSDKGELQDFLAVQQGYLSQHAELRYARSSIRIDAVSALQRCIAAKLGIGPRLFEDPDDVSNLPFYIVEHLALLPTRPDPAYDEPRSVASALRDENILTITADSSWIPHALKVGQLIDLVVLNEQDEPMKTIANVMVSVVREHQFDLDSSGHAQLANNLDELVAVADAGKLRWCNSNVWLGEMSYSLRYTDNQDDLDSSQRRVASTPFPVTLRNGDQIEIHRRIGAKRTAGAAPESVARVVSIDALSGTLVIEPEQGNDLPGDDDERSYDWLIAREQLDDRFSFVVSVVFPQSELEVAEPEVKAAWFAQIVREAMPAHITVWMHWLDKPAFNQFADDYRRWQNAGEALGDRAYNLLQALSIGQMPAVNQGIGARKIADEDQYDEATNPWNQEFIDQNELFYVPGDE